MGIGCGHDDRFSDWADEGTGHCVYCRALAAEVEIERLRAVMLEEADVGPETSLYALLMAKRLREAAEGGDE